MKTPFFLLVSFIFLLMLIETKSTYIKENKPAYSKSALQKTKWKDCIDACDACVVSCKKCESMCLQEKDAKMNQCIQSCREAAIACSAAAQMMRLNSTFSKDMCAVAAKICESCAAECGKFLSPHCKECAIRCKKAAKMCRAM